AAEQRVGQLVERGQRLFAGGAVLDVAGDEGQRGAGQVAQEEAGQLAPVRAVGGIHGSGPRRTPARLMQRTEECYTYREGCQGEGEANSRSRFAGSMMRNSGNWSRKP